MSLRPTLLPIARRVGPPDARAVGIVANEFFDPALGRMGGFGWAARTSAECLAGARRIARPPVLLAGRRGLGARRPDRHESGIPLVKHDDDRKRYARRLDRAEVGLFLTVDYRPNYLPVLEARDLPTIVWICDPRTPADVERIATLELPSRLEPPQGVDAIDCRSLGAHVNRTETAGGSIAFASPAPALAAPSMRSTYDVEPDGIHFLPNPVSPAVAGVRRAERPRVAFLGRLDPIKRPWVFVELARRFPRIEFVVLGRAHFEGPGSWHPGRLPSNVTVLGHVDGESKRSLLGSARCRRSRPRRGDVRRCAVHRGATRRLRPRAERSRRPATARRRVARGYSTQVLSRRIGVAPPSDASPSTSTSGPPIMKSVWTPATLIPRSMSASVSRPSAPSTAKGSPLP